MPIPEPFYIGDHVSFGQVNPVFAPRPVLDARFTADASFKLIGQHGDEDFTVVRDNAVIGFVGKSDLQVAIAAGKGRTPIEQFLAVRFVADSGLQSN